MRWLIFTAGFAIVACQCDTPVCQPGQCDVIGNACGNTTNCGGCGNGDTSQHDDLLARIAARTDS